MKKKQEMISSLTGSERSVKEAMNAIGRDLMDATRSSKNLKEQDQKNQKIVRDPTSYPALHFCDL